MFRRTAGFLFGLFVGILASGLLYLLISKPRGQPIQLEPAPSPLPIRVHVAGGVLRPGVYALPAGSIVEQAIEAAGGLSPQASLDHLNLAGLLQEGQLIAVATLAPTRSAAEAPPEPSSDSSGLMNINLAEVTELDRLPGIGPALAQEIVRYRETHGPFSRVEDLLNVPGIGPAKLSQIRDLVSVD